MELIIFVGSLFMAGMLSFFSPCIFPLLPVYVGILCDNENNNSSIRDNLKRTIAFVLGISLVFIFMGISLSVVSHLLNNKIFHIIMGVFIVILGLHQLEIIHLNFLYKQKSMIFTHKLSQQKTLKAFFLGISLSFCWSPCVTPILGSVMMLLASSSLSFFYGIMYMFIYSLGFSIPFLIFAYFSSTLQLKMKLISRHLLLIKKIGALFIVFIGLIMIFSDINILNSFI